MIKKFITIILTIIIILTTASLNTYGLETDYEGHWAENTIKTWIDNGFIKGYPDGSFNPEGFVTRAEFVKMVNSSFGYIDNTDINFNDVLPNDWYYPEVQKAFKIGYITGVSNEKFLPNDKITREQAAVIVSKILELDNVSETKNFSDSSNISSWALNHVNALVNEQLIKGYSDNSLKPQNPVTRAEAVEMLDRALLKTQPSDLIIDKEGTIVENKIVNNLHITKEVGNGNVTIKNVIITGELLVEGGGQNSIIIENSDINQLTANKIDDNVRILLSGDTSVDYASVKSNIILDQSHLTGNGLVDLTLDLNSSVQLQTEKKVSLSSSDKSVVATSSEGTLTALKEGRAIISATINGKETQIYDITVTDPAKRTIKILSIGNSFSQDTAYYLYDIAKSADMNIIVGNLYSSGCSLERHWNYASNNEKAYIYYKWASHDMMVTEDLTMKDVLLDEDWDYITFQQSSGESGIYSTYQPYLNKLITYVKKNAIKPNVKFALNMTWAYASISNNENYAYYGYNQYIMFNEIVNSYKQASLETGIDILIPCGTAIQNARTNKYLRAVGNDLTSDSYHLNTGIGRYIAGLTLFETIIKEENIDRDLNDDVKFTLPIKDGETLTKLAKKAVKNAVIDPYNIQVIK